MALESRATCDKCDQPISFGDDVYCFECFNITLGEVEKALIAIGKNLSYQDIEALGVPMGDAIRIRDLILKIRSKCE